MNVHELFKTDNIESFGNVNNAKMYNNELNVEKVQIVQPEQYNPNGDRSFNLWTRSHSDVCEYENQLRVGSKPIKYYVNQLNTPQNNPFMDYTTVGNQQVYNVQNNYQTPVPTRLNPIYQTYVFPYSTTPNLGQASPSMMYSDTESNLRFGNNLRNKKSAIDLSAIDYNRWDYVSAETVQNGGQFQPNSQGIDRDGFFDYKAQNNVLFGNSAWPYFGISSRNQLHNAMDINSC
jgi:hypothetical protein